MKRYNEETSTEVRSPSRCCPLTFLEHTMEIKGVQETLNNFTNKKEGTGGDLTIKEAVGSDNKIKTARSHNGQPGYLLVILTIIVSLLFFSSQTHATLQENVIFESIGEMA